MASSEEDGTNGASEASDEKEAAGKRRRLGLLATAWLTFYNIAMTAGWLVLAIAMVRFYMEKGTHRGLYKSIQKTLKFFQTFALLEVVHCLIGIVPTSVLVTGVQVSSRIFMVWLITHSIKPIQFFYHLISRWSCWGTSHNIRRLALRKEVRNVLSTASQQVQCFF
uniref:Very-long-chain (3R)-3-hydroxyacyl-CoA dehydratase n=1 Tax=Mus spicilegus TaxID=10103 RepID=A0A8C6I2N1_MUSSI